MILYNKAGVKVEIHHLIDIQAAIESGNYFQVDPTRKIDPVGEKGPIMTDEERDIFERLSSDEKLKELRRLEAKANKGTSITQDTSKRKLKIENI